MKQLTRVGVYGVVLQEEKILLVHKTRGPYTGLLDLPGGRLKHGERVEAGLHREILEETNLAFKEFTWLLNTTNTVEYMNDKGGLENLYMIGLVYLLSGYDSDELKSSNKSGDINGAKWLNIKMIMNSEVTPFALDAIKQIKKARRVFL